jgi:hypothetical protein
MAMSDTGSYIYYIAPGQTKVARSVNHGATFFTTTCPVASSAYYVIACSGSGAVVVAAGTSTGGTAAQISTDYGLTWAAALPTDRVRAAGVSNDGSVIVLHETNNGPKPPIFVSTNSGASFVTLASVAYSNRGISMSLDGSRILLGMTGGVGYYSVNKGSTFTSFSTPAVAPMSFQPSPVDQRSLDMSEDGSKVIVAHAVNSEKALYISVDNRATWTLVTTTPAIGSGLFLDICMSPDGNTIYVSTSTVGMGIIKSTDGGGTWTVTVARAVAIMVCSYDATKISYYAGTAVGQPAGLFTIGH